MRNKIFQFLVYLFVYDLILFAYKCTKLKLHASNKFRLIFNWNISNLLRTNVSNT